MNIPFIDLKTQFRAVESSVRTRLDAVLEHGRYIMGPEVGELEQKLAAYVGAKHAVSCSSGTDALLMALMAKGIGPGDAVFTSTYTFVATAEVISLVGATPIFVDIDPVTFNIDLDALERAMRAFEAKDASIHPLPANASELTARGVIPVDLFGLMPDYDRIENLCREHGLFVLQDAAQSFGAQHGGRRAGSCGDVAATSFFPAKPLGCYGDGGMVFTDSDELKDAMVSIRVHGKGVDKYDNVRVGLNARIDTMQAAVLLAKFERFPDEVTQRQGADRARRLPLGLGAVHDSSGRARGRRRRHPGSFEGGRRPDGGLLRKAAARAGRLRQPGLCRQRLPALDAGRPTKCSACRSVRTATRPRSRRS